MTILHASDLHFGRMHRPQVARAIVDLAAEADAGAVVVSGDLTQRAKAREYADARRFLDDLGSGGEGPRPVVATPGNHDVPLYRVWERLLAPYRHYRSTIAPELDSMVDAARNGAAARFVALNSAAPRSAIVNGRLGREQRAFASRAFASSPAGALRVLVVHHNLVDPSDGCRAPVLRGSSRILPQLGAWGVDLVLSGHIHRAHLAEAGGVPVVIAGTACSGRGRAAEKGRNTVNLVRVEPSALDATVYRHCTRRDRFVPAEGEACRRRYPRRPPALVA